MHDSYLWTTIPEALRHLAAGFMPCKEGVGPLFLGHWDFDFMYVLSRSASSTHRITSFRHKCESQGRVELGISSTAAQHDCNEPPPVRVDRREPEPTVIDLLQRRRAGKSESVYETMFYDAL